MYKCPYCGHDMKAKDPHRFDLSPKQKQLFDFITVGGIDGADNDTIMSKLGIKSYTTLRTRIHGINKRIAPLELTARGRSYRLEKPE